MIERLKAMARSMAFFENIVSLKVTKQCSDTTGVSLEMLRIITGSKKQPLSRIQLICFRW